MAGCALAKYSDFGYRMWSFIVMVCGFAVDMDYSTRLLPRACVKGKRFVDLSPATMSLLDRLILKHNFDTVHHLNPYSNSASVAHFAMGLYFDRTCAHR